jgi:hypothetical protein
MSTKADAEKRVEAIRIAAETNSAKIVSALVLGGSDSGIPAVALGLAEFVDLIAHVRPKVLYLWEQRFDAQVMAIEDIEGDDTTDDEDMEEEVASEMLEDARFKTLVKRWRTRDGQISRLAGSFMMEGILHVLFESEAWAEEFDSEVQQLAESFAQHHADKLIALRAEAAAAIREKARQLSADPMFNAPKVSRAKREYLALHLFAGADDRTIGMIVEEAEKLDWLETGRGRQS